MTLLVVSLVFFNLSSFSANYTLTNTTWSPSTPSQSSLTNADSIIIKSGTWTLTRNVTVKAIRLSGGTLAQSNFSLTGGVSVKGSATISGTGSVVGAVVLSSGTLTLAASKTASSLQMSGGTLALAGFTLTSNVTVDNSSAISATRSQGDNGKITGIVKLTSGTLTMNAENEFNRVIILGGTLNLSTFRLRTDVTVASNTTISSNGGRLDSLTLVSGDLNLTTGDLDVADLYFNGGNLDLNDNTLTTSSDVSVAKNASIDATTAGGGILELASNNLSISGGSLSIYKAEMIIDNLIFSSATTHKITTTNGGMLSFDASTHTLSNIGNSNHVDGIIRYYLTNSQKTAFTFPIGDGTVYAPIKIDPSASSISTASGLRYIQVEYFGAKNDNNSINTSSIKGVSGSEFWVLSTDATNPVAKVTLLYNSATTGKTGKTKIIDSTFIRTDLKIASIASSSWSAVASSANNAPASGVYSIISTSSIIPSGTFSIGSANTRTNFLTPLPVSIIDFTGKANEKNIDIKWSTASEKDNASFVVEKSLDGKVWSVIGSIKGARTSNVVNNYGLVDYKPSAGIQYYRLKQLDLDGSVNYSKAIAVNFTQTVSMSVNLFPNPAKDVLNITTENNANGEISIQIVNSMGESMYNQVLNAGLTQTIDIASYIPGIYYVTVISEGESKIFRLLKN